MAILLLVLLVFPYNLFGYYTSFLKLFEKFTVLVLDLYEFLDFFPCIGKLFNLIFDRLSLVIKDSLGTC